MADVAGGGPRARAGAGPAPALSPRPAPAPPPRPPGGRAPPTAVPPGRPPAALETDGASPHPCEVLDIRLGRTGAYVAGAHYGIADIAIWPWVRSQASRGMDLAGHPNLERWFESVGARPAVQRGIALLADRLEPPAGGEARENPSGTARPAQRRGGTRLQA